MIPTKLVKPLPKMRTETPHDSSKGYGATGQCVRLSEQSFGGKCAAHHASVGG